MYEIYWEPHAEGGKSIKRDCHGRVGPQDTIEFEREGIRATVHIYEKDASTMILLSLRIPPQVTLKVPSWNLNLTSSMRGANLSLKPIEIYLYDPSSKRHRDPVDDWMVLMGENNRIYYARFASPAGLGEMVLPAMTADDTEVTWPHITYSRQSGWYIYPINC